jgi:DsbC/DsbD-like thiol-disulfide interchange protein/cytochrome c biogenesis protein CcdA
MRLLALLVFLLPSLAFGATSNIFTSPRDQVSLISQASIPTGGQLQLALKFHLTPGWHIYWSNPGDAGLPPAITPTSQASFGPITFPPPELLLQPPIAAYVLSGSVILPFTATNITGNAITTRAQWLVCANICVPEHANFTLPLNGGPAADAALFTLSQIMPSPFPASIAPDGTLSLAGPAATQIAAAHFFPNAPGMLVNAAPQNLAFTATGLTLKLPLLPNAPPLAGLLELTDPTGAMRALSLAPSPTTAAPAANAHLPYVLLAFLGGLILNLMPCVFPILALKALAITRLGGGGKRRHEAFGYTAGILAAMLVLAAILLSLRALGAQAGWGFQFQSPIFVAVIAWIILAVTLNLAGVFEVATPAVLCRIPAHGSIATGFLTVALATPCTAPFMGAALAAALAAPLLTALGIFLALGLGLAAPFLILALIPGLARLIPRPGAWMLHLQRLLALPMLATFLWLAWVLFRQTGPIGLLILGAGTVFLLFTLTRAKRRPLALAALLLLPFLHPAATASTLALPGSQPYTAARLASLRTANTPVFIDLTAAWCITCLVNEASTLKNPEIQASFTARHITLLVGDWTDKNPEITALLTANHRDGVPLYLYYSPGKPPITLPQILTPGILQATLAAQ